MDRSNMLHGSFLGFGISRNSSGGASMFSYPAVCFFVISCELYESRESLFTKPYLGLAHVDIRTVVRFV